MGRIEKWEWDREECRSPVLIDESVTDVRDIENAELMAKTFLKALGD